MDPLTTKYPWYTPYQFSGNKPIWAIDLDGLEPEIAIKDWGSSNGYKWWGQHYNDEWIYEKVQGFL